VRGSTTAEAAQARDRGSSRLRRIAALLAASALGLIALPATATAANVSLALGVSGTGEVKCKVGVGAEEPCATEYPASTALTLIAHPAAHFTFAGWSAGTGSAAPCTGTANCTFTLTAASSLTATFAPIEHSLTVNLSGTGEVDCEANAGAEGPCASAYPVHTELTLIAHAGADFGFGGWSAGSASATLCTGSAAPCTFFLEKNSAVTANFVPLYALTIERTGTGAGTVASSPGGIECGALCSAPFTSGVPFTLTAAAAPGSVFAHWSGGGCKGTAPCTTKIKKATTVKAAFTAVGTRTLTVAKAGTGAGTVTGKAAGIECGSTCTSQVKAATKVGLIARPAAGSTFAGWSGACAGTKACQVKMSEAENVTATFQGSASPPPPGGLSLAPRAKVAKGKALLRLSCMGTSPCSGALKLRARLGNRAKTIGKASFGLAAGAAKTVEVKLSTAALKALRRSGTLKARASGAGVAGRSLTLALPGGRSR
jgi:hypothetical protein